MTRKEEILDILAHGKLELKGQFVFGSNYSFLVSLDLKGRKLKAVYKPQKGGMPLYDFPADSLAAREVAAYLVSETLGWDFVPPTVIRKRASFGTGSLQEFIPHNPEETYFSFDEATRERLRPVAVFDLILNNADRKGSHILLDRKGNFKLIDHGLCFHSDPKLRTVIWDFSGQAIPEEIIADVKLIADKMIEPNPLLSALNQQLQPEEITALASRVKSLIEIPVFPQPDPERRPFPWPLV
jgi:uncharacterized repeat protein (TIGR03843 family)